MQLRGAWVAALLVVPSLAHAQSVTIESAATEDTATEAPTAGDAHAERARELFLTGAELAREGRWKDALAAFEQSAQLIAHPTTLYNIGYTERALGHYLRARQAFLRALSENEARGGSALPSELLSDTRRFLDESEQKIVRAKVQVPNSARLAVDGRPLEVLAQQGPVLAAGLLDPGDATAVPSSFELWLDPGAHVFSLTGPGGQRQISDHRFASGASPVITLELDERPKPATASVPAAGPPAAPSPREDRLPSDSGLGAQQTWAVVLGGVALVGAGVGTYYGLRAHGTYDDALAACPGGTRCPDDEGSRLSAEARDQGNVSTIAFATAGGALVGAAILWLTAPSDPEPAVTAAASLEPGGGGLWIRGGF